MLEKFPNRRRPGLWLCLLLGLLAPVGCGVEPGSDGIFPEQWDPRRFEGVDWKREVEELYRQAKEAGEEVPDTVSEWVAEDYQKLGAWEYATDSIPLRSIGGGESLEAALRERGMDRWQCFFVLESGDQLVLLYKRPMRSYLNAVPIRELVRFFTLMPGSSGE